MVEKEEGEQRMKEEKNYTSISNNEKRGKAWERKAGWNCDRLGRGGRRNGGEEKQPPHISQATNYPPNSSVPIGFPHFITPRDATPQIHK